MFIWFNRIESNIKKLLNKSSQKREMAAKRLIKINDTRTISLLLKKLDSTDSELRRLIVEVLVSFGFSSVYPLVKFLIDQYRSSIQGKSEAAEALGRLGDRRGNKFLLAALEKNLPLDQSIFIIEALGRLKEYRAIEPIIDYFKYHSDRQKLLRPVSKALGRIGSPAFEPMIDLLNSCEMTDMAALALGELGDQDAVEQLQRHNGLYISIALAMLGDNSRVQNLVGGLAGSDGDFCADALLILGPQVVSHVAKELVGNSYSWNEKERIAAARLLGDLGGPKAIQALAKGFHDAKPDVREAVQEAIVPYGLLAVGPIRAELEAYHPYCRESAEEALKEIEKNVKEQAG